MLNRGDRIFCQSSGFHSRSYKEDCPHLQDQTCSKLKIVHYFAKLLEIRHQIWSDEIKDITRKDKPRNLSYPQGTPSSETLKPINYSKQLPGFVPSSLALREEDFSKKKNVIQGKPSAQSNRIILSKFKPNGSQNSFRPSQPDFSQGIPLSEEDLDRDDKEPKLQGQKSTQNALRAKVIHPKKPKSSKIKKSIPIIKESLQPTKSRKKSGLSHSKD